ncbi:hypothetical protein FDP41_001396 [Naegleria fowleri]|uniref:Enolase C-terminal domain-containing protein n=1 Tax=Naegleria fowleri TaxID=5763 RepID=A0A6A5C1G0_NAEFO|nr:uncharacterized protein FDP41_001396 [Naegleria fowleri]KAF0979728.1 hypothetical protein FDP41_001396 [Naegleria fowleri]CAG4716202.1 unnamed protein product [Naegleria fowleri]
MPSLVQAFSCSLHATKNLQITLQLFEYHLELRSAFGTSHSSTTHRKNSLVNISIQEQYHESSRSSFFEGFGECGLPPKKPNCYLADFDDIKFYFEQFCKHVERDVKSEKIQQLLNFDGNTDDAHVISQMFDECFTSTCGTQYFSTLKEELAKWSTFVKEKNSAATVSNIRSNALVTPLLLLYILDKNEYVDQCGKTHPEFEHCAQCVIEMAILDLWSKIVSKPLYSVIGIPAPIGKFSFYTAALNEDIQEIVKTAKLGLTKTKHLKIKLDSNIDRGILIVKTLLETYEKEYGSNNGHDVTATRWSIDANTVWTPELSLEFLRRVKTEVPHFLPYFYMLEQPFPISFESSSTNNENCATFEKDISLIKNKWIQVKQEYENAGILIFADESVNTFENIPVLCPFIHGINIKLEKAGGIRGALKTAIIAQSEYHLRLWFGCMVSSRLSCTCSSHLMSLSEIGGDLDGDLLVTESSQAFEKGFTWKNDLTFHSSLPMIGPQHGEIILQSDQIPGIGVDRNF